MLEDRAAFGVRNEARRADIAVAGSEVEGAPLRAAFDPSSDTVWWTEGSTALADFHLAERPVQVLFLRFPILGEDEAWFAPGDEVTLTFGTAQGAADAVVTGEITPDPYTGAFALWLPEPVRAAWARVSYASSVALAGIATDYLSLSPVFQPYFGWQPGTRTGAKQLSTVRETLFGGSAMGVPRGVLRERTAQWDVWPNFAPGELAAWRDMRDRLRVTEPFVWSGSPAADHSETFLARFTTPPHETALQAGTYTVSMALREVR